MGLLVLRTQRLVLWPWTLEEIDALHAVFTEPEVRRYLWDDVIIARDVVVQSLNSHTAAAHHGIGYWTLHLLTKLPSDTSIAGFCGFRFIEDDRPEIELLCGLLPEYWGKGLACEACRAAIEHLFSSTAFQRVYARTDSPNVRSLRVMQRLGMTPDSSTESTITYVLERQAKAKIS